MSGLGFTKRFLYVGISAVVAGCLLYLLAERLFPAKPGQPSYYIVHLLAGVLAVSLAVGIVILLVGRATDRAYAQRNRYRSVLDSAGSIFLLCDPDLAVVEAGRSRESIHLFQHMSSSASTEIVGRKLSDLFSTGDMEEISKILEKLRDDESPGRGTFEFNFMRLGKPAYFRIDISSVGDDAGRPDGYLLSFGEISDYRCVESTLKEQNLQLMDGQRKYRDLWDKSTDAFILISPETGVVEDVNDQTVQTTGMMKREMVGKNLLDIFPGAQHERLRNWLDIVRETRKATTIELPMMKGEAQLFVSVSLGMVTYGDDTMLLATLRDVTHRRRAERDLREMNSFITALNEISKAIQQSLELGEIFHILTGHLKNLVDFDKVALGLLNQAGNRMQIFDVDPVTSPGLKRGDVIPRQPSYLWQSLLSKKSYILIGDEERIARIVRQEGTAAASARTLLTFSLEQRGNQLGVLSFESERPGAYSFREIQFVERACDLFSTAIINALLLEKERRLRLQGQLIAEISQKALSSLDLNRILQDACGATLNTFRFANVYIFLLNEKTQTLILTAVAGLFEHFIKPGFSVEVGKGIVGTAVLEGESIVSNDVAGDPRYINETPGEQNTKSEMAILIRTQERILGVLDIQSSDVDAFDESDKVAFETFATQLANAILNAENYQAIAEYSAQLESYRRVMYSDLNLAAKVQRHMLPLAFVSDKLDMVVKYIPQAEIGGDYTKVKQVDNLIYVIIGDVTGHGIASALIMSSVDSEVTELIDRKEDPEAICRHLNEFILTNFEALGMYLTFFCGVLDLEAGTLSYINNGHPSPILLSKADSATSALESNTFPLGMVLDEYHSLTTTKTVPISRGDRLILYTDGLFSYNEGAEVFNEDSIRLLAMRYAGEHIRHMSNRIMAEVTAADRGAAKDKDDRLLVILEVRENQAFFEEFSTVLAAEEVIAKVSYIANSLDYTHDEQMDLRLCLFELMVNAIKHGHDGDPSKYAKLTGELRDDGWDFTIEDEGKGFDYTQLHDPFTDEALFFMESGRGIALSRRVVDYLVFNQPGNRVSFGKKLKRHPAEEKPKAGSAVPQGNE